MKKGFTLIELLAVILILGIIALIAIPQVTNVIEDSKKGAVEVSGENYIKAIQDRVSLEKLKDGTVLEGVKTVSEINTAYPNLVSGNEPTTGSVIIASGKVKDATFEDGKYTTTCTNGKCEVAEYVYFQSQGEFTSLDQTVTTRPTQHKVYLKTDKNDITKKQACYYDNGKELCLNPNDFETTKQKILNYFGYNSSWENIHGNTYFKVIGQEIGGMCEISDLGVECDTCYMQDNTSFNCFTGVNITMEGNVEVIDILGKFVCAITVEDGVGCNIFEGVPAP